MNHQKTRWMCGPAAIANALEVLGIHVDQETLVEDCHVTPEDGTDEVEVKRAILAYGCKVDEFENPRKGAAGEWLSNHLITHGPAILCVANYQHWVTAIGLVTIGGKGHFWVFDPAAGRGLELHSWNSLAYRWRLAGSKGGPMYYAIGVAP